MDVLVLLRSSNVVSNQTSGTIYGSEIVRTVHGPHTGDVRDITAAGRVWERLNGGVPNTVPTGAIISTIDRR